MKISFLHYRHLPVIDDEDINGPLWLIKLNKTRLRPSHISKDNNRESLDNNGDLQESVLCSYIIRHQVVPGWNYTLTNLALSKVAVTVLQNMLKCSIEST